jgi:outer membrane protein insertion porin family
VLLLALGLPSLSWAQSGKGPALAPGRYTLSGIAVEGIEFTDKSAIVTISGLSIGQEIRVPGTQFSDAVEKLWKQKIFSDVEIRVDNLIGNKLFITFVMAERPRIAKYRFQGISKQQADELREKVALVTGTILTEPKKRGAVRAIRNYFQEKGFYNCKVDISAAPDNLLKNSVVVTLKVDKGERVKIRRFEIEGNTLVTDAKLKKKFKDTKQKAFWRVWKRSKFQRGTYTEEKKVMLEYYNSLGFRDARIVSDTIVAVDKRNIDIVLKVYEGNKYFFRNITYLGNNKYTNKDLAKVLGIRRGQVYNSALLEKRLSQDPGGLDLSSLYLDEGHLFFRAEPVEVLIENDSIDIEIRIYEGPIATYDRIILEGNTKTSDHVILREIRTLPGNKFSRSEIIRSQREILNLGYFNQENMNVIPIPNQQKGTVDVKYIVEEKPSDQLSFQAGWGGAVRDSQGRLINSGLVLTLGLTFTNFAMRKFFKWKAWRPVPSGDGQRLNLQIQVNGATYQNYGFGFTEPWLGGKRPNLFGFNFNYQNIRSATTSYKVQIIDASVSLGRRLKWPDDFFQVYAVLQYRYYDVRDAGSVFQFFTTGQIHKLSLKTTLERSSIDAPIFPRSGSTVSFTAEFTPPWSLMIKRDYPNLDAAQKYKLMEFYKFKFDASMYVTVIKGKLPLIFKPRVFMGILGSYNSQLGTTPFERFYLGGDGLQGFNFDGREIYALRGYQNPFIGPNTGSAAFVKFNVEFRQPLSLSPQATVWLNFFAEAGNAWARIEDINPFVLRRSAGFGVRLFLPIFGLLGVDYAFGLDAAGAAGQNRVGGFHFFLGQQF